MGEYVSTYIAPQTLATTAASAPPSVQALPATIAGPQTLPALETLTRPLSINGQVLSFSLTGELSLQTNLGKIELLLSKSKSDFFQTLNNLIASNIKDGQKPLLELIVQPGTPAKEAFLLVPLKDKAGIQTQPQGKADQALPLQKTDAPIFTKGQTLSLTPIPKGVDEQTFLQKTGEVTKSLLQQANAAPKGEKTLLPQQLFQAVTVVKEKGATLLKQMRPNLEAEAPRLGKVQNAEQGKMTAAELPAKMRIDQIIKPKQDWPVTIKQEQVKAEVIGRSLSGQTLIKSQGQHLIISTKGTLPQGSKILATPLSLYHDYSTPFRSPTDQKVVTGLQELIASLQAVSPKAAQNFINQNIPSPQQNMNGTLLFLLAAIQGNKIEEWIGATRLAQLTTATRKNITDALTQSLSERGIPARDDHVGDWRSWSIPIMNEHAMDVLRFYVRQDQEKKQSNPDEPTQFTRFVITMNMKQLGHMQLDGLSQIGKLDLIIRSERTLPKDLKATLQNSTSNIYEAIGLKGAIQFQENAENWINFKNEREIGVSI